MFQACLKILLLDDGSVKPEKCTGTFFHKLLSSNRGTTCPDGLSAQSYPQAITNKFILSLSVM